MEQSTKLLSCGHVPTPDASPGTGYAMLPNDRKVCYTCADYMERERLRTAERFSAYVSSKPSPVRIGGNVYELQTWTGGRLGDVVLGARHPWSDERHYVTAVDVHGNRWHGTGAPGMWCTLRRVGKD